MASWADKVTRKLAQPIYGDDAYDPLNAIRWCREIETSIHEPPNQRRINFEVFG